MTRPLATNAPATGDLKSVVGFDGVTLDYEVVGSGPPVVLLHGAFAGRVAFSRQRPLAEHRRLVLPSSRAHDKSDGRLPADYGLGTTEVQDVCAVVDAERLDRFDLVGHSSGGVVAFAFARKYPQRVNRLILIEPTLLALLPSAEREVIARAFGAIIKLGKMEGDLAALSGLLAWLGGDAWKTLDEEKKAQRLQAMGSMAHITVPHVQALLNFEVNDSQVKLLDVPGLLIYGAASYPFEAVIQKRLRALQPNWRNVVIDGAGHNSFRERPDVVNAALRDFLETG